MLNDVVSQTVATGQQGGESPSWSSNIHRLSRSWVKRCELRMRSSRSTVRAISRRVRFGTTGRSVVIHSASWTLFRWAGVRRPAAWARSANNGNAMSGRAAKLAKARSNLEPSFSAGDSGSPRVSQRLASPGVCRGVADPRRDEVEGLAQVGGTGHSVILDTGDPGGSPR